MTNETVTVKQEVPEDEEDDMDVEEEDVPTLGPAALGLQRVGTPAAPKPPSIQPTQVLNARGMPARIRKKNKLFFDDDIVNTPHHRVPSTKRFKQSPTKKTKSSTSTISTLSSSSSSSSSTSSTTTGTTNSTTLTPNKYNNKDSQKKSTQGKDVIKSLPPPLPSSSSSPAPLQSTDRKIGQKIGLRLRNVLKLPKAHKWVCYEWFYSDIDRCLFSGENDFSICLKESFPELKTRELTRVQWTKIRRMMGKPRRCSQAFFHEERLELEKKRKKIRAVQQRKATEMSNFKDLPPEIPMQLVIGTKVTARLRKPQDGLFTGSIDAVDTSNNTYRITFERQGLGTHSVPDYEVLSNEPPETISISSFQNKFRPRNCLTTSSYLAKISPFNKLNYKKDPLLSGSIINKPLFQLQQQQQQYQQQQQQPEEGRIGGYPMKLLEKIVIVTKILNVKKLKINDLKSMNTKAEKMNSFQTDITDEFKRNYASILIDLEKLNNDLQMYLNDIQQLCHDIAPEPSMAAMLAPSHLREKCRDDAHEIIQRQNSILSTGGDKEPVKNDTILDLITDLTALMLQVKCLSDSDQNAYELHVLQGTMEQIKQKLSTKNQLVFQNCVEIHMKHIQVGLSQTGNNSHNISNNNINDKRVIVNGISKI